MHSFVGVASGAFEWCEACSEDACGVGPPLTEADRKVITSIRKLIDFFLGNAAPGEAQPGASPASAESLRQAQALLPVLQEYQQQMRAFGLQIVGRLAEKQTERALGWVRTQVAATGPATA